MINLMSILRIDVKTKKIMKKQFLLVGVIVAMGLGLFFMACDDDEDNEKSCSCTESDYSGYNATRNVTPSSYGAANCADLELKLKAQSDGEYIYSCH
jgi:hypothetical protein